MTRRRISDPFGGRSVQEWIGATPDSAPPDWVRDRVFVRAKGRCHITNRKIGPGEPWQLEHKKPLSMGGENRESNLAPALVQPHRKKSAHEADGTISFRPSAEWVEFGLRDTPDGNKEPFARIKYRDGRPSVEMSAATYARLNRISQAERRDRPRAAARIAARPSEPLRKTLPSAQVSPRSTESRFPRWLSRSLSVFRRATGGRKTGRSVDP